MILHRGIPVIINDTDEPSSRLVAVLTEKDRKGVWHALYLSTYPSRLTCWTGYVPTPLDDFGVRLELHGAHYFRCVPTGGEVVATYRDGTLRRWQCRSGDRLWDMRPRAAAILDPQFFTRAQVAA
jgi:hypothetical protein